MKVKTTPIKTLENEVIIHDEDCPMCRMYTGAFIRSGMLEHRMPYHQAIHTFSMDKHRARHEIALINTRTGDVTYGIDSLVKILSNNFPAIRKLASIPVLRAPLNLLYHFISYNRKMIAPGKMKPDSCNPDFHLGYRILYLVFTWLVCSVILATFSGQLSAFVGPSTFYREFFICGGQILFQSVFAYIWHRNRWMDYLGNMMTVSLIGSLLLLPFIWIELTSVWSLIAFLAVVGLMLTEHIRRLRILEMTSLLTGTWILYRLLILNFIL